MATSSVFSCLGNIQSRYKRLVNNIFPSNPTEGLVKSNMDKLTFYALQAPEKLDRIGDYMFQKISNHLYRKRLGYVYIAMEAMDHLLLACRSSSLNLFVESFLKMVSLLLESSEIGLQICATNSFVKFANIDEDTPSYHRRYEFFISRFSQLCYGKHKDVETERKLRLSGLQGLQGVVRKTVNDDLQANIWDDTHMSKIVPSLLFNIECNSENAMASSASSVSQLEETSEEQGNPAVLADLCLRELVTRAGFNNIAAILYPLLKFMDSRNLWLKNEFPLHIFKIIMYSIPNQYSYRAIELLFSHLDKHKNSEAKMRASVVEMISASVSIATGGSIGPSLLEVFNTLLTHLKISVDFMCGDNEVCFLDEEKAESLVQKAIINAAGAFSSILADYQRVDVMLFIIMKIPNLNPSHSKKEHGAAETEEDVGIVNIDSKDEVMQVHLLKCLLQVTKSHKVKQFSSTFSSKLVDFLVTGICTSNPDARFHVQEFWLLLLDRHQNIDQIGNLSSNLSIGDITFNMEKSSRQDSAFIKKHTQSFFFHIYESCRLGSNKPSNLKMLTYLICLLLLEFEEEDYLVELVGFVLGLQHMARSSDTNLSCRQQSCIHALAALFFFLVDKAGQISGIHQHCQEVIGKREEQCNFMLPSFAFDEGLVIADKESIPSEDEYYFDRNIVVNALKSNNFDTIAIETPYEPKHTVERSSSITSIPDNFPIQKYESQVSIRSNTIRNLVEAPVQKITYEDLKDALRGEKEDKTDKVLNFQKVPYNEIINHNERVTQDFENTIKKSLEIASRPNYGVTYQQEVMKNLFEIDFPALYIY